MKRYRKILVAVDASGPGKDAFRQACAVARRHHGWVTALTVVPPYENKFDARNVREIMDNALRGEAEKTLVAVKDMADAEGVHVRTLLKAGNPSEVIAGFAEEEGCDLIVMGKNNMGRLERALSESVTAGVISQTRSDVLVVRAGSSSGWESILLSTDGSRSSAAATKSAIDMASALGADLSAVGVAAVNDVYSIQTPDVVDMVVHQLVTALSEVRRMAEASNVKARTFIREGEAHKAITDLAKGLGTTLIVMGTNGRRGLKRLLMGSVTEQVIGNASCPVLVVKPFSSHRAG